MQTLYDVKGAAAKLNVSRTTIYALIKRGVLKPVKVASKTQFAEDELEKAIQTNVELKPRGRGKPLVEVLEAVQLEVVGESNDNLCPDASNQPGNG